MEANDSQQDDEDIDNNNEHESVHSKSSCEKKVEKCIVGSCNKFYHLECLKTNPNVDFYINNKKISRFRCPHHYCSGCGISGNSVQILQCVECPTSYHLKCFRADRFAIKLTKKFILCGKHSYLKKNNIFTQTGADKGRGASEEQIKHPPESNAIKIMNLSTE